MPHRLHSRSRLLGLCFTVISLLVLTSVPPHSRAQAASDVYAAPLARPVVSPSAQKRVRAAFGTLPMHFERNQGQFDPRVRFAARGAGYNLWLTASEAVLSLHSGSPRASRPSPETRAGQPPHAPTDKARAALIHMKLINANPAAAMRGEEELQGRTNSFIGKDARRWQTDVKNYAKVKAEQVYRGIDLVYYGNGRELEYDFDVAAGADPAGICLRYEGAQALRVDATGELIISTAAGEMRQHRPVAYQQEAGQRRDVAVTYALRGKDKVRFALGPYDHRKELVIDPALVYSTLLGGTADEEGYAIAVDAAGSAYVTGYTFSSDFPLVGAFQTIPPASANAFVAKLDPTGTALVYSTYLGGNSDDYPYGIAVDAAGNAYVTGTTWSDDFPTVGAIQATRNGVVNDAFITKLDVSGAALVYSTYLGGTNWDESRGVAVDAAGNAYIAGRTHSTNFPTVNPLQPNYGGFTYDAFVAKLNAAGSALVYSTYLGGSGDDTAYGIAVDAAGNAYVTGLTYSADFPTATPLQAAFHGKNFFRSLNGGGQWDDLNTGLPTHLAVKSIAIDPGSPSTLYAGTTGGIYKTTNGGANWSQVYSAISNTLAIDRKRPTTIYSGNAGGIVKSTDGGATWAAPGAATPSTTNVLVIDPAVTSTLYAGVNARGFFKSTDGGATWGNGPYPLNRDTTLAFAIDPTKTSTIYAGMTGSTNWGVWKTTDGGASWTGPLLTFGRIAVGALAIDPRTPDTIYAGTQGYFVGLFKSIDGGATWALSSSGLPSYVNALVVDPVTTKTVYAGTTLGVYKSTDAGATWHSYNNGLTSLAVAALVSNAAGTLYAGTFPAPDAFVTKLNATGTAMLYATYLGGDGSDGGYGIAVDAAGNAYAVGYTWSHNFPVANALKPALVEDATDLFITKLSPTGTGLVYSTYFGGSDGDYATAVALDAANNVFVTGETFSADFPVTDTARAMADSGDAFVLELSAAGGSIIYSTYLGGHRGDFTGGEDRGNGIAVDAAGNAYVIGLTQSADFPTTAGALRTNLGGYSDAFVAKITPPCAVSLSATSLAIAAEGGSGSISVSAPAGCAWQAASNDSWIVLTSDANGSGNGTVTFDVSANPTDRFRAGSLSIGGQTVTINQAGSASTCHIQLRPTYASYPAAGGSGVVEVVADDGCVWKASTDYNWIRITVVNNGVGNGSLSYMVAANPNRTARIGTIIIGGQSFAVKQKGR